MARTSAKVALGAAGGLAGFVGLWGLYRRFTTETVPYEVVDHLGDVEVRRYPPSVVVQTVARTEDEAYERLFRYLSGDNEDGEELELTAPVEVDPPNGSGDGGTVAIPMTVPVQTGEELGPVTKPEDLGQAAGSEAESAGAGATGDTDPSGAGGERMVLSGPEVRMSIHLPPDVDIDSAPLPTDERVTLVSVDERTLAVRPFRGRPTDQRVRRRTALLLEALDTSSRSPAGEPFYMGYDAPLTLPPFRRNEVAVEVEEKEEATEQAG